MCVGVCWCVSVYVCVRGEVMIYVCVGGGEAMMISQVFVLRVIDLACVLVCKIVCGGEST